jgi:antitoxin component of MazEF toxin-antitoxin module
MRTKLTNVGDDLALVIDQEILDALGYTSETEVEIRVQDGAIVIEPVGGNEVPQMEPPAR